jgi:hypothetical protein
MMPRNLWKVKHDQIAQYAFGKGGSDREQGEGFSGSLSFFRDAGGWEDIGGGLELYRTKHRLDRARSFPFYHLWTSFHRISQAGMVFHQGCDLLTWTCVKRRFAKDSGSPSIILSQRCCLMGADYVRITRILSPSRAGFVLAGGLKSE